MIAGWFPPQKKRIRESEVLISKPAEKVCRKRKKERAGIGNVWTSALHQCTQSSPSEERDPSPFHTRKVMAFHYRQDW